MSGADFYALSGSEQAERLGQLAQEALRHWDGGWRNPRLIKHRENAVFAIEGPGGERAVLRIHRHGYHDDAALASELQWIRALDEGGINVPSVIPSRDGAHFVHVSHPLVPEQRQVDILGWVEGRPIGSVEDIESQDGAILTDIYLRAGAAAAHVHALSEAWTLPDGFSRHAWDRDGLVGPSPFWGRFLDLPILLPAQRELLERACAAAAAELDRIGTGSDVYGLIHADFVPENIFVQGDDVALIDFDDAGFGWHMFELATALFFLQGHDAFPAISDALFEGYEQRRPGKIDRSQLPLFLFLRGTTYLGWIHTRSETDSAKEQAELLVAIAVGLAENYLGQMEG